MNNGALKEGMSALSRGVRDPDDFIEMLAGMILRSARLHAMAPELYEWRRRG